MSAKMVEPPTCPYCGRPSVFITSSAEVYGGRDYGPLYICRPCKAWCGVHDGTANPLGRLANAELRTLKQRVHAAFDPLWVQYWRAYPDTEKRSSNMRNAQRARSYAWLAHRLGIPAPECHIGMFSPELCRRAIEVLERERPRPEAIRHWWKARTNSDGAPHQSPGRLPAQAAKPREPGAGPLPWED